MRGLATIILLIAISWPARSEPMTFFDAWAVGGCSACGWVAAEGEITSDTPTLFRRFLQKPAERGRVTHVYLNSQGGDLVGGVELGRLFRANHITVEVLHTFNVRDPIAQNFNNDTEGGKCVSACSYAFIGGEERYADSDQIGIHQFTTSLKNSGRPLVVLKNEGGQEIAATLSTVQAATAYLIDYVNTMGVDPRFLSLGFSDFQRLLPN
jgi:hypothetical protein